MALIPRRTSKVEKLNVILAFASNLIARHVADTVDISHIPLLHEHVDKALSISDATAALASPQEFDEYGIKLWNHACKRKNSKAEEGELGCLTRVYACLLLDFAYRAFKTPMSEARAMKTVIRAAKQCLDHGLLSLAEKVVQKAADYDAGLMQCDDRTQGGELVILQRLSWDYMMLRVTLAWRQNRLDLAKILFGKMKLDELEPRWAENVADLTLEIGKDQIAKASYHVAQQWLEKSYDLMLAHRLADLSADAPDLKMTISYHTIKALLKIGGDIERERARGLLIDLRLDCGDRLVVLLLELDLLSTQPTPIAKEYSSILERIIRSVHLTHSNFKTIVYHVHKLKNMSAQEAYSVLKVLLLERLYGAANDQWIEKVIVTAIWVGTTSTDIFDPITRIRELLDLCVTRSQTTLSPGATHAAQMLLSKKIEANYREEDYDMAENWCGLACHTLFDSSGRLNRARLQRKQMLCAIGLSDLSRAREIVSRMAESDQHDPNTQYLLFKIALRCRDTDLGNVSKKDAILLYACVLEAQKSGDRTLSVASLQQVLKTYHYQEPAGVYLPALLRCTIRLLTQEIESIESSDSSIQLEICKLFEGAIKHAKAMKKTLSGDASFLEELAWFSRNSYNLSIRHCASWKPHAVLRLTQACLEFINLYPLELNEGLLHDLALRRLFCDFICISLLTNFARSEINLEAQLQYYLDARTSAADFRSHYTTQVSRLHGAAKDDLERKHTAVLVFNFEAAARLKAWEDLTEIINRCEECEDLKTWGNLADIVLGCEAPGKVKIEALQQIVAFTSHFSPTSLPQLSRWIRCLYALALPSNPDFAQHLLNQVVLIVHPMTSKNTVWSASLTATTAAAGRHSYPAEELEYLATTAYNQAIDFHCEQEKEKSQTWAEMAMSVAELLKNVEGGDGGALFDLLGKKWSALRWEDGGK